MCFAFRKVSVFVTIKLGLRALWMHLFLSSNKNCLLTALCIKNKQTKQLDKLWGKSLQTWSLYSLKMGVRVGVGDRQCSLRCFALYVRSSIRFECVCWGEGGGRRGGIQFKKVLCLVQDNLRLNDRFSQFPVRRTLYNRVGRALLISLYDT